MCATQSTFAHIHDVLMQAMKRKSQLDMEQVK